MGVILFATGVIGGIGLVSGLLLTAASKVFAVPVNPLVKEVRDALPGANCGACGFPGCDGLAIAIAEGTAGIEDCPVGGMETVRELSKIMGIETPTEMKRKVVEVICRGGTDRCKIKFDYEGIQDCVAASLVNDGYKACSHACLGLGTCVAACQFGALTIDESRKIVVVDYDKCTGCEMCVAVCPRDVLAMREEDIPVQLLCREAEKGKVVRDICNAGCIGCGRCARSCKFDAIEMVNNLPIIDREKCVGCMVCAEVCPTWAMWGNFETRKIAQIKQDDCIGCGICKKVCKFESIAGEIKYPHQITEACTGCGECVEKCPKKCITLVTRSHERDAFAKAGVKEQKEDLTLPN